MVAWQCCVVVVVVAPVGYLLDFSEFLSCRIVSLLLLLSLLLAVAAVPKPSAKHSQD